MDESASLTPRNLDIIQSHQTGGLGISMISCWEVAKLVEKGRLSFDRSVDEWLELALAYPGIKLIDLTIPIILQSTRLADFHNDPADQKNHCGNRQNFEHLSAYPRPQNSELSPRCNRHLIYTA